MNISKNLLLIVAALIGSVILAGLIWYLYSLNQTTSVTDKTTPTVTVTTTTDKIVINNPFINPVEQFKDEAVFASNDRYQISYYAPDSSFIISILSQPVSENRQLAEQDFLNKLNISQESACKLDVRVSVPFNVDSESPFEQGRLSFCN